MDSKSKTSFSELKVGIFVVITCVILAVAIFTIGTQVGLLQETFVAKTYLNTVSGLKPGDVVLLGGVEVGNVLSVNITSPGQLPDTPSNVLNVRIVTEANERLVQLDGDVANLREQVLTGRVRHTEAVQRHGQDSAAARRLEQQLGELQRTLSDREEELRDLRNDLDRARNNIQNIEVYLQIIAEYREWIRADSSISLGSVGLLGDRYIEISLGRTEQPPIVLTERVPAWVGTREREVIVITGTRQAGFQELITGANDILANFETLSEKLQQIMGRFEEGEGSVGKFFSDPAFYNNLNMAVVGARETIDRASQMVQDITQGPGTIPRMIQERELYDRINSATARLETVVTHIESGEGTVGRLLNDPTLYRESSQAMASISGITERIEKGQGTLGRLSTDEQLYVQLRDSVEHLNTFMNDVEHGKGTLGKLAKDEQLYQNMNQVSSEIVKLIYDFRQNPRRFLTIKFEIF
jgi:phospholipid/cholesterol/gamma-HCH transport system substrate-binding protein